MSEPLASRSVVGDVPLSARQLSIWTGQKLDAELPLYNMAMTFRIEGDLDVDAFRSAFQKLVDTCDALRMVIVERHGTPWCRTVPAFRFHLPLIDASDRAGDWVESWAAERSGTQFQLDTQVFDAALVRLGPRDHLWFLNAHHLIVDAWSMSLLLRYQAELYDLATQGQLDAAPTLPSFADHLAAERVATEAARVDDDARDGDDESATPTPISFYGRTAVRIGPETTRVGARIDGHRARRLSSFLKHPDITTLSPDLTTASVFNTVVLAVLHRISGVDELAIGVPFNNRAGRRQRDTVGLFFNIAPLRASIADSETMSSLLAQVRREVFDGLRRAQRPTDPTAESAAFEVVVNYINAAYGEFGARRAEMRWLHCGFDDRSHTLRLQILASPGADGFELHFDFKSDVFDEPAQTRFVDHFLRVLDTWLDEPDVEVASIELPTGDERERLVDSVDAVSDLSTDETILTRFADQVRLWPHRPAVLTDDDTVTYAELDERSDMLAHELVALGAGPDRIVALCTERTVDMIVGIIGIQKSGAAYLPLAPSDPLDRLKMLVRSSESVAAVGHAATTHLLDAITVPSVRVDRLAKRTDAAVPSSDLQAHHLAYVLFTSGSTGEPKATMIEHRNVLNLVDGLHERIYRRCSLQDDDGLSVALIAPIVFDPSVQQIFGALLGGHRLVIASDEDRTDGDRLQQFLERQQIDIADGTPGHLTLLADRANCDLATTRVQHYIIGGEVLPKALVRRFLAHFPGNEPAITNAYGPAECCVDCLMWDVTLDNLDEYPTVPIGVPLPGESAYILDQRGNVQPVGVAGELCLGGRGVGRGYLHAHEQSAARFVPDPFTAGRLYRTGDLARRSADGVIEFVGRSDSQVKIRGHRVEIEEVESALKQFTVRRTHIPLGGTVQDEPIRCSTCLLSERHPGVQLGQAGVCSVCRQFDAVKEDALAYFRPLDELGARLRTTRSSRYDCLLLYSGGKDSSYVLYRLVEMGLRVLAYTFDNGHISQAAFRNIERQTSRLGVDSIVNSTERMDEIFLESLNGDSTVCSGCFKSLTTISTRLAHDHGIRAVVTGLSRGQIFDTKLAGLIARGIHDVDEIDEQLRLFRRAYHANRDRTAALLDADVDGIELEQIEFIDFFRYDEITTDAVRDFLQERDSYWRQPHDTGFCSSNCRMNDVGIAVHSVTKGYHNYEAPLSWDIRLGVATRQHALDEVAPVTNVRYVNRVLDRIGYSVREIHDVAVVARDDPSGHRQLWAYFVASQTLTVAELRSFLAGRLPEHMIPARFIQIDRMPLTPNGKLDRSRLEADDRRPELGDVAVQPETPAERAIASAWSDALGIEEVGVHDNYFELGGDSINAIQIASRAADAGWSFSPRHVFECQTVRELSAIATPCRPAADESPTDESEPATAVGRPPMVDLPPDEMARLNALLNG